MKKTNLIIGSILVLSLFQVLNASQVKTSFSAPYNKAEDNYGNITVYQDVDIKKSTHRIDNIWGKFSNPANDKTVYKDINTKGTFKLSIEQSFACRDGGLNSEGCSSQKPFLINEGILDNPDMKLDAQGGALPLGEYRIPFDSAANYDERNNDSFYALDIYRDGKFYKDPAITGEPADKANNFFSYMISFFKDYFSKDTHTYGSGNESPEQRDRYIANITFGAQKDYRLAKSGSIATNEVNTANSAKHVSLLDYNSQIVETTTGCNGLFFSFSPNSLTCKSRNFFGMSNFMPFINSTPNIKVKSDSVVEDTETTLLTLAGNLDDTNYLDSKTRIDPVTGKRTVVSEIFKPVTFMAGSMFRFFFGNSSRNLTEIVSANFDFKNQMPLTFIETDGSSVKQFRHFLLMGLESVYGTEVESCKVKETSGILGFGSSYETYTAGVPKSNNPDFKLSFLSGVFGSNPSCSDFSKLKNCKKYRPKFSISKKIKIDMDETDWLSWCKRNQGRQKKGLFGRIFDTFSSIGNFLQGHSEYGTVYDQQLDSFLSIANFTVKDYKEKVHKGLILHLKATNVENIGIGTVGTTTTYKLMKIK